MSRPPVLGIVVSHPIQYQAPLFRELAARGAVQPHVLYLSDHGMSPSIDPGFGRVIRFDVDLTGGFSHQFLANRAPRRSVSKPTGLFNPALIRELNRERFDAVLVFGHAHLSAWLAYALLRARRIPYLVRGESQPPSSERGARSRLKRTVLRPVIGAAAACAAIGSLNRTFYVHYGAAPERVVLAPYSVDNDWFRVRSEASRASRAEQLTALGLDPRLPTVLFAAKLAPGKRPLDLLDAHGRMSERSNLLVVGDGELAAAVRAATSGRAHTKVLGFQNQSEIAAVYGVSDIYVLPSSLEQWGLAVNEAMAAGVVPVVSDAVGCAPDLVTSETGRTYPVGDVGALASALDELVGNASLRTALVEAGRSQIGLYSLQRTADGIEQCVALALSDLRDSRRP
jgi:glycosyltransferase involved in cell wall biosynthesis